ncbi:MAG: hypothetical protein SGPRY_000133 [Prymnesium sp.]
MAATDKMEPLCEDTRSSSHLTSLKGTTFCSGLLVRFTVPLATWSLSRPQKSTAHQPAPPLPGCKAPIAEFEPLCVSGNKSYPVHGSSWALPWHRQYLYEVERLLVRSWLAIRCDHDKLASLGWPRTESGAIAVNTSYTDADGVTSFITDPCKLCIAIPYWRHARDAGKVPNDARLAAFDPLTFGGSGLAHADGCFNTSMFRRVRITDTLYTVGNWGAPQRSLPNARSEPGAWGSIGRCLRRPFDGALPTPFLNQKRVDALLARCEMPWLDWQEELERSMHDPGKPPQPDRWPPHEYPNWAIKHADSHFVVYDDCEKPGCLISDVGECDEYSHDCDAPLEPFASRAPSFSRPASFSSPKGVLNSERLAHSCVGSGRGRRCDCVQYEDS